MNELPGRQEDRESRIEKYSKNVEKGEPIEFFSRDDEYLGRMNNFRLVLLFPKVPERLWEIFDDD